MNRQVYADSTGTPTMTTGIPELDLIGALIGQAVKDVSLPVRLTHNNPRLPNMEEHKSARWFLRDGMRGLCAMAGLSYGYITRRIEMEGKTK